MPDVVVNALVNAGILGPVLAAIGFYVIRRDREHAAVVAELQRKLDDAHNKRVEDAQRITSTLLEHNERWQRVMAESVRTAGEANQTMERIRETLDKVWDRLHLPRS
jgi:hypothetical protein